MGLFRKNKKIESEETTEKKPGFIKRLWRKFRNTDWKDPVNRYKLLFASMVTTIVLFGVGYGAIHFTSSSEFCSWCHEMAPEYNTYKITAHSEIKCVDCHIEPGIKNKMISKVQSLKEVYYHVVGVPDPIVQTVGRVIPNKSCVKCHSENRLVTATGDLIVNHDGHIDEGVPCVSCHSGVAHAKVVERGINYQKDMDYWTAENAEKLVSDAYTRPNMGTCIDCHDKVNKGERPWKDKSYLVPENPHAESHASADEEENSAHAASLGTTEVASQSEEEKAAEEADLTQDRILQAIGKQKQNVKISMECFTCHKEVAVPKNHEKVDWDQTHGDTVLNELDKCINCHLDEKWIRRVPKQDIISLINAAATEEEYKPNMLVVKNESRDSKFCATCHADRPPGHVDSDTWLTAHAPLGKTDDQKAGCYVCHDRTKPEKGVKVTAPTDVYCEYCHRTGFKDEKKK